MRTNGHGKPVVSLDIDGTLGDYHGNFITFAKQYFGMDFPNPETINPGLPLWEFLAISKHDYREAKLAYRQGGWKRWMPCYDGADLLTSRIRDIGAEVWICTTRPYLRLDNVDPDTREWLRRNRIAYDAVLFDRVDEKGSKYAELKRQAGDRVCAVVDDLPEMIEAAREEWPDCGDATILLRDQPYNRHVEGWPRVGSCFDIWTSVARSVRLLKLRNGVTE